jgi:tRNA-specific adenosine deaminase 1
VTLIFEPENVYLTSLTLAKSQYVEKSIQRAFLGTGRLQNILSKDIPKPYSFTPFQVQTTNIDFIYSRRVCEGINFTTSNKSTIWTPDFAEIVNNGVLQGRKASDLKGASRVSRRELWKTVNNILKIDSAVSDKLYGSVKADFELENRRQTKSIVTGALLGWITNEGDELFTLKSHEATDTITKST